MSEQTLKKFVRRYAGLGGFGGVITGLLAPVMYVVLKEKGYDSLHIGMMVFVTALVTAIFNIPFGILADRYGRKRVFLLGELFMFVFCIGLLLFDAFSVLLALMAIAGLSAAMASGTLDALFVDTIETYSRDPKAVQQSSAVAGGYQMGGVFAGAFISSVLAYFYMGALASHRFEINYLVAALLIPLHMLAVTIMIPSDANVRRDKIGSVLFGRERGSILSTCMNNSVLSLLLLSSSISALAFMSFEKFWKIKLSNLVNFEGGQWLFGAVYAGSKLVSMIGQLLSPRLCRAFGNNYNNVMIFVRIALAAAFSTLYFLTDIISFVLAFLCIFLIAALSSSPVMTLFHNQVRETERTAMLSLRAVFLQVGAMAGILIATYAAHTYSLEFAFLLSAIVFLLSTALMLTPKTTALGRRLAQGGV
ncbi:MFS transporter [Massilia sp. S19_KUP03_FR1]|uniref:MFS transporter n=1 Tax=Massilia sp. S19_KUP03_FR1 TaxID=3025503 RepID=UPI002FCD9EEF